MMIILKRTLRLMSYAVFHMNTLRDIFNWKFQKSFGPKQDNKQKTPNIVINKPYNNC